MKKLLNKKGFTLMEMMIVIAIIVILVAIAVPSFNSSLEKANTATDSANERTAESLGLVKAMDPATGAGTYHFDVATGDLATGAADKNDAGKAKTGQYIQVVVGADGSVTVSWQNLPTTPVDPE
ncbi:MAG: prepilin-type N-terminal cleavage/methylation domain-containing protein [Agathobacter sp.]|nr:prepilin-type N-terminal cleavage/methylation domain-containing protein [Agathobacter sp.]